MRHDVRSPNLGAGEEVITIRVYGIGMKGQPFAKGGLASHAKTLARAGRYGDDMLVHMNRFEFEQLKKAWGEPTINPKTGLPEYFWAFLLPILKAVLTNAAIGAASAAVTGGDIKKGAIIGGITGGLGGLGTAASLGKLGSFSGTGVGQALQAGGKWGSISGGLSKLNAYDRMFGAKDAAGASSGLGAKSVDTLGSKYGTGSLGGEAATTSIAPGSDLSGVALNSAGENAGRMGLENAASASIATPAPAAPDMSLFSAYGSGTANPQTLSSAAAAAPAATAGGAPAAAATSGGGLSPLIKGLMAAQVFGGLTQKTPEQQQGAPQNMDPNFLMHLPQLQFNRMRNPLDPASYYTYGQNGSPAPFFSNNGLSAVQPVGLASGGFLDVNKLVKDGWAPRPHGGGYGIVTLDKSGSTPQLSMDDRLLSNASGMLYPSNLPPPFDPSTIPSDVFKAPDPVVQRPAPMDTISAEPSGLDSFNPNRYGHYRLQGGLPQRKNGGPISGPGTGRSDDIPAKLSDGEYVIDSESVALLGDGSARAGAARLDAMREKLRQHKGRALARGKFSPKAKAPESYMRGAK